MAPQYFEAIAGTSLESKTVCRVHHCNIHVTLAPETIYGNVDYYKDPKKNVEGSGFKSRYYDFLERHQNCNHTVPDYYEGYGDKYVRLFSTDLYPRLSKRGKEWLVKARYYLQKYIEIGFKQNKNFPTIEIQSQAYPIDTTLYLKFDTPEGKETLELDSQLFREFAFKTHPIAYADGGFHDMDIADYRKLLGEINWREYKDLNTWKQMWTIGTDGIVNHPLDYASKVGKGIWYEIEQGYNYIKPHW